MGIWLSIFEFQNKILQKIETVGAFDTHESIFKMTSLLM